MCISMFISAKIYQIALKYFAQSFYLLYFLIGILMVLLAITNSHDPTRNLGGNEGQSRKKAEYHIKKFRSLGQW